MGSDLRGARLNCTSLAGSGLLEGADLRAAVVSHVVLRGTSLRGADLRGTLFEYCDARGACLVGTDATGARWEHSSLAGADFSGSRMEGAFLRACDLSSATFDGALLRRASLAHSICDGASFSGARLDGAWTLGATFRDAGLANARNFFLCREIIAEVLRREIGQGDEHFARLVGSVLILPSWCYNDWKAYVEDKPDVLARALDIFSKYPHSGATAALRKGWQPDRSTQNGSSDDAE